MANSQAVPDESCPGCSLTQLTDLTGMPMPWTLDQACNSSDYTSLLPSLITLVLSDGRCCFAPCALEITPHLNPPFPKGKIAIQDRWRGLFQDHHLAPFPILSNFYLAEESEIAKIEGLLPLIKVIPRFKATCGNLGTFQNYLSAKLFFLLSRYFLQIDLETAANH